MKTEIAYGLYAWICRECPPELSAELCGDLARLLDDETAGALHAKLAADPVLKTKLVRPLWYDYDKQEFRAWTKRKFEQESEEI